MTKKKNKHESKSIKEIDKELEKLDKQRIAIKEEARELMEAKTALIIKEELVNRIAANVPFTTRHMKWMEDNPEEWKKIKEENKDKKGTRTGVQVAKAGG